MVENDRIERTFLLIKPDAVQRGKIGQIISRFEDKGLKLVALKMLQVTPEQASRQYACHKGKAFYDSLVEFICSSPSVAMVLEGRNAVALCRRIMGATDPMESCPGTIRGDGSLDVKHNLIHGSDCHESYKHEVKVYFTDDEILKYNLELVSWIYYS